MRDGINVTDHVDVDLESVARRAHRLMHPDMDDAWCTAAFRENRDRLMWQTRCVLEATRSESAMSLLRSSL